MVAIVLVDFIEYYIFQVIMARTVVPRFSIMLLISCVSMGHLESLRFHQSPP